MPQVIDVYLKEDPYLTNVVVQTVTKAGQYLNESQAQNLIVTGQVRVNGLKHGKTDAVLAPGFHSLVVGPNSYQIHIHPTVLE